MRNPSAVALLRAGTMASAAFLFSVLILKVHPKTKIPLAKHRHRMPIYRRACDELCCGHAALWTTILIDEDCTNFDIMFSIGLMTRSMCDASVILPIIVTILEAARLEPCCHFLGLDRVLIVIFLRCFCFSAAVLKSRMDAGPKQRGMAFIFGCRRVLCRACAFWLFLLFCVGVLSLSLSH